MEESVFNKIVSFLSSHFELIIYASACSLFVCLVGYIYLKLREVQAREALYSVFRGLLFGGIVVGQIFVMILLGGLYWQNYKRPAPELQLSENVSASTQWVKSNLKVYFIDQSTLRSIEINGRDLQEIFSADGLMAEYHFSPDGVHLLVLTDKDLFLVNRQTKVSRLIDTVNKHASLETAGDDVFQGAISGIRWAADGKKFVYEMARWSKFTSQDSVHVYTLAGNKKRTIQSPTRRMSSLFWNKKGDGLYFLRFEAQDTSEYPSAFEAQVYRIDAATLVPELTARFPIESTSVPDHNLSFRGIDLYLDGGRFSFGRPGKKEDLISENGSFIGIDKDDYLFYVSKKWFRRRLFKIPREPRSADMPRYQYKGGDLLIDHLRWVPGGRYVIMEHKYWGILILEPSTGKVGLLVQANGRAFGWFHE